MVLAHAAAAEGRRGQTALLLGLTALGGGLFLVGQWHEYFGLFGQPGLVEQGLKLGASAYASTFFVVTSFHGLHVLSGVIYLAITGVRVLRGSADAHEVEVLGLFWHFVDLVWILVFTFVYLL
jgi:cytochrome c oxidase subunit III